MWLFGYEEGGGWEGKWGKSRSQCETHNSITDFSLQFLVLSVNLVCNQAKGLRIGNKYGRFIPLALSTPSCVFPTPSPPHPPNSLFIFINFSNVSRTRSKKWSHTTH